ncbi:MAG: calcium-binding protein [Cyanobacteria bacterium RM1_2_2]|nr:calcium-binding protein [Cyanobacteria bacterium RM1_2_2]
MAIFNGNDLPNVLVGTNENDSINGNGGNDFLFGLGGNDLIDGGTGADQMFGGLGDDVFIVDNLSDKVFENLNQGNDAIHASVSFSLFSAPNVENLALIGTALGGVGNELDNTIYGNDQDNGLAGNDGNDSVYGRSGNDALEGGSGDDILDGGIGNDRMSGSNGKDTYFVDSILDEVTEFADNGIDLVNASVSYTLSANLENLTLLGTANIDATGNELDNILTGNAGDNILDGKAGKDTLIGGLGNDTYIIDAGDIIVEKENEGIDTVNASISYTLSGHVENLTLTGTANIDATGNALDNTLTGNSGNNILDGGIGTDQLIGGLGNDTYVISDTSDTIVEASNAGLDTVNAAISYTLGDNLENLTLTGIENLSGTGNTLDNTIKGNAGSNILNGKEGNDTLIGGLGNDIYIVNDAGDQVIEGVNEGIDIIAASVSYTLSDNVEHLGLTGTENLNATGNALDNILLGNAGVNTLDGGAGNDILIGAKGRDTLKGGTGADKFVFTAPTDRVDRILDFSQQDQDKILLVSSGFSKLKAGSVKQKQFVLGRKAQDKNDRLIYNSKNGALFYDADGKGGAAQVRIATFANKPALGASDFTVGDAPVSLF